MNSREQILQRIKANKPEPVDYPKLSITDRAVYDSSDFKANLETSGGKVVAVKDGKIAETVGELFPEARLIVEPSRGLTVAKDQFKDIDVAIIHARLGVAENGAVWITEQEMVDRSIPFICQHLVITLEETNIVSDMHIAFDRIQDIPGYGVFVAGPSKTADIEQSLVIGAHGPVSHTVLLC